MSKKNQASFLQDFEEMNWRNLEFKDVLETFTYSEQFHLSPRCNSIGGDIYDRNLRENTDDMMTPKI